MSRIEDLAKRGEDIESGWKRLEESLEQPPVHSPDMIARMNLILGFPAAGPESKDADYRPYCLSSRCGLMPRMVKTKIGFACWHCDNVWDLRLICQHKHPDGVRDRCDAPLGSVEWTPVGYRCRRCAGMHHFTGMEKTASNVRQPDGTGCPLPCCSESRLAESYALGSVLTPHHHA